MLTLPAKKLGAQEIQERLAAYRSGDLPWRDGKVWAYVYPAPDDVTAIQKWAFTEFLTENALDPTAFPSLLRMENEVVAMCAAHLGGDEHVVGNLTTGGTESCMMAVKTARDWARKEKKIAEPEIVLPVTAHAAFFKAAHYFDVKAVVVDVDPVTFRASPEAVRAAMNENTALLVVSAPSYAHGVVDPIAEVAALAEAAGILCHVDGCIGGFLLPYFRRLGRAVPAFDFTVPGVTSMSMDLHKYAYCPKGASVVLYKNKELRKHQIFACSSWTGYTIVNPTFQSTKSGGPIAAAWATLHAFGDEGYLEAARQTLEATDGVLAGIRATPGLRVMGNPEMSLVCFTSDEMSPFIVADEMIARGYYVQPQLAGSNSKENIHLSITAGSLPHVKGFVKALGEAVATARGKEHPAIIGQMTEMAKGLNGNLEASMGPMMAAFGIEGSHMPERMGDVNALLNGLPSKTKETILTAFVNDMFLPPKREA